MEQHYRRLLQEIDRLVEKQNFVVLAIDGPSGSGKSTLARFLEETRGATTVQMDHFFLRPEQRTEKRLATPGGNVDYERFTEEVVPKLRGEQPFTYEIYDCQANSLTASPPIALGTIRVVEGSYSLHPELRAHYDLKVFLTIEPAKQKNRILQRNGPKMYERFIGEWIPLENLYFTTLEIQKQADLVFPEYKQA